MRIWKLFPTVIHLEVTWTRPFDTKVHKSFELSKGSIWHQFKTREVCEKPKCFISAISWWRIGKCGPLWELDCVACTRVPIAELWHKNFITWQISNQQILQDSWKKSVTDHNWLSSLSRISYAMHMSLKAPVIGCADYRNSLTNWFTSWTKQNVSWTPNPIHFVTPLLSAVISRVMIFCCRCEDSRIVQKLRQESIKKNPSDCACASP
jgi:hypothetical protein